jgi:SAM-dependent MidA family methyltransferase
MADALYGPHGFYVQPDVPARNFRTSSHASPAWSQAIVRLATRVDEALGSPEPFTVVDVGAGGGELLDALAVLAPPRWSLLGVDVAPRPVSLPASVDWQPEPPATFTGVLIATELLDVVPVDVVELTGNGPRIVEVTSDGLESLGDPVSGPDLAWLHEWWQLAEIGDRAEIGRSRDEMWRSLTARLERGLALAIDYAAIPSRDVAGTLTGYREGRQVVPVPDGSCDVTSHVMFDSCVVEGDLVITQREALQSLGVAGARPSYDGNPTAYLAAMSSAGAAAELLEPSGLGGFTWLIHAKGVEHPIQLNRS